VAEQVVEGEQVAQGVQHGDGQVELAGDGEVTHVGLHDGQGDVIRRRSLPGAGAHGRAEVHGGGVQAAAGELAGVFGRAGREFQDAVVAVLAVRSWLFRPVLFRPVLFRPPEERAHLARNVAVGACGLVELRFVIDSWHPTMMPDRATRLVPAG